MYLCAPWLEYNCTFNPIRVTKGLNPKRFSILNGDNSYKFALSDPLTHYAI